MKNRKKLFDRFWVLEISGRYVEHTLLAREDLLRLLKLMRIKSGCN